MEHLKKALQNRRGKGLDIHILVGHAQDDQKTDLAPEGKPDEMGEGGPSAHPIADMHHKLAEGPDGDADMQEALMGGMSDHDKMGLQKPGAAKSLGQKARLAALLHKK